MRRATARPIFFAFAALATAALVGAAQAQTPRPPSSPPAQRTAQAGQGPANALQGFSKNRDEPVQIEAASLEVRDKDKVATFSGNVHVIQGDTNLRSKTLVVYYEEDNPKAGAHQGGAAGTGRRFADQAAGSQRQCAGHPEGPDRHRRKGRVRHAHEHDHADRQRGHQSGTECACVASGWWSTAPPASPAWRGWPGAGHFPARHQDRRLAGDETAGDELTRFLLVDCAWGSVYHRAASLCCATNPEARCARSSPSSGASPATRGRIRRPAAAGRWTVPLPRSR